MADVPPWLDVFSAREIALAAGAEIRDVEALLESGRVPTVDGRVVAAGHAVSIVRSLRAGAAIPMAERGLFQPAVLERQEPAIPFAGAVLAHAVLAGALVLMVGAGTPPPAKARVDSADLVYLSIAGPGGGGGGGGVKAPTAPGRAEIRGTSAMRSPVPARRTVAAAKAAPAPVPPPDPAPQLAEPPPGPVATPEPPVVAPVASVAADRQDHAGLPSAGTADDSRGSGTGDGAGSGSGTGLGDGQGAGIGSGSGGGTGGGPYRPGSGISPPSLLHEVKPDYSEEARRRGINGDVELEIIVRRDGSVGDVRLLHGLGAGLDQRAIEAVRQWRFSPARRLGTPVDVLVEVAVEFKLR